MKNETTIKTIGKHRIIKLRGGRSGIIMKDPTKYNRKSKHKRSLECYH